MINNIITYSVKNKLVIGLFTLSIIIVGIWSMSKVPIDAVPDITNTQVQINTKVKGLVPEEVERMVTFPIEYSMNGIPAVENIRSISRYGISQVTVIFKEGTDIYKARQLASEKLQTIQLPVGVTPEMGPISTGLGEIFHYSLEAKNVEDDPDKRLLQLMELRSIQDWFIKPRLLTVKGVTEVNTIGGYERQYHIEPDPILMARYGLHFDDIEQAIERVNKNAGGGYIEQTADQFIVQASGLFEKIDDIKDVPIKRLGNLKVISISDIAKVRFGKELRTGAALYNGEEVVVGTVLMLLGENSREVSLRVSEQMEKIKSNRIL